MSTKEKIEKRIATEIGVFVAVVPLYVMWVWIASKFPNHQWEIIIGFVFYMLASQMAKESKK